MLYNCCAITPSHTTISHVVVESVYYIQVCSQEDSQNHLAQTAQYFCNAVGSGAISHSEINVAMVEQKWKGLYKDWIHMSVSVSVCV